jgi:hypothetical protein
LQVKKCSPTGTKGKFKLIAVLFIAGKIKKEKAASVSFRLERRDEFLLQLCGIIKTAIARADNGREGDEKWSLALALLLLRNNPRHATPPAEMRKAAERERAPHTHTLLSYADFYCRARATFAFQPAAVSLGRS